MMEAPSFFKMSVLTRAIWRNIPDDTILDINIVMNGGVAPAAFYSPETLLFVSGTDFCQMLSKPQGLVLMEGLGKWLKITHLIGS
jgi:hypothetical protein